MLGLGSGLGELRVVAELVGSEVGGYACDVAEPSESLPDE